MALGERIILAGVMEETRPALVSVAIPAARDLVCNGPIKLIQKETKLVYITIVSIISLSGLIALYISAKNERSLRMTFLGLRLESGSDGRDAIPAQAIGRAPSQADGERSQARNTDSGIHVHCWTCGTTSAP
jgi:hypothetical protein